MSKTRKLLLVLLSLACVFALAWGLASCTTKAMLVDSIALYDGSAELTSESTIDMEVDDTRTITVSVSPENASDQSWKVTSSDTGAVYAYGYTAGNTGFILKATSATSSPVTITVTAKDDSGVSASFKVNVTAANVPEPSSVPVTGFTADSGSEVSLSTGDTKTINITAAPDTATDKTFTAASSNEAAVTVAVSTDGTSITVTAVASGSATITITANDGSGATVAITITVTEPAPEPTPSFSITAEPAALEMTAGDTADVAVTVTATDSDNTAWDYALTQSGEVVSVTKTDTGLSVEALAAGEAAIVVTAEGDSSATATITITVTEAPAPVPTPEYELTVSPAELDLTAGGSAGFVAVSLAATNGGSEEWSFTVYSGDDCIEVDQTSEGLTVTAVAEGTAVIYVYAVEDTAVYGQVTVNAAAANVAVESITASPTAVELTLSNGNTVSTEVEITVLPADATDKSWTAESEDESVATAKNEDGTLVITAVGAGTTTITITAEDGSGAYATVDVTVNKAPNPIQSISIGEDLSIDVGSSETVTVTVTPTDADDAGWDWSVSEDGIVSVTKEENNTLTITGLSAGTVTLTVTSTADSTITASAAITVSNVPVNSITVYQNGAVLSSLITSVAEYDSITLSVVVGPGNATSKDWTATAAGDITITAQSVEDGTITIYGDTTGSGVLTITAADDDSYSVDISVSVVGIMVDSVELTVDDAEIAEATLTVDGTDDESITVDVAVKPDDADEKTWGASVSVTSGTGEVVSIDPDSTSNTLTITAVSAGVAVVTVNASGVTASITVTVNAAAVTGITVNDATSATVDVQVDGEGAAVAVAVVPGYAGNQEWGFTITSGDDLITAEQDGSSLVISARSGAGSGTAYITVYADEDNDITAQITVNVLSAAVTDIYANGVEDAAAEVQVGTSVEAVINVTFGPSYTEQTGWAYTISAGDDLIDVFQNTSANTLTITAKDEVEAGEAVITVYSTANEDITATITVTVKSAAVDSITTSAEDDAVSLTLVDNAAATITVTVGPSYASDDLKGWEAVITGTEGIVSIEPDESSSTLTITALAKGETQITITSTTNADLSAVLSVSVAAKLVTSITLTDGNSATYNGETVDITLGDTLVVAVSADPDTATDTSWTVESRDPSVASVADNEDGTFTITANAVSSSAVTITVTANGGDDVTAVMYVNVIPVYVSSFTVEGGTSVTEYESITLTVTVNPDTATNKAWTAAATGNITITAQSVEDGTITVYGAATGSGTITITASDDNGYTQDVTITVVGIAVDSVTLTDTDDAEVDSLELTAGSDDASAILNVVIDPSNADDLSWSSSVSEEGIVTVSEDAQNSNITITAVSAGTVTVTVTASGKTASVTVTVYEPSFEISASPESLDLIVGGEDGTVAVAVAAEHSSDETWDYTVSQEGTVISVTKTDSGLTVEAVAAGAATITVFANGDSSVSKDIAVTVVAPSFAISADPAELSLTVGEEDGTVAVSVTATNSTDDSWDYTVSQDGTVISVTKTDSGLTIEAVADGTAAITVYANGDNSKTADITVTVSSPATASISGDTSINYPTSSTGTLALTVENGTVDSVEWSSSVTDVATVSGGNTSATVTPGLFGSTVITATVTLETGKQIEATATVYVTNSFFYLYGVTGTWIDTPYTSADQASAAGELLEQQGSEQIYSLTLDIAPTTYGWQIAFKDISSDWNAEITPASYYDASRSSTDYITNYGTSGFNVSEKGIYTVTLDLTDGVGKVYITENSIDVENVSLTIESGSAALEYKDGTGTSVVYSVSVTPDDATYDASTQFTATLSSDTEGYANYVEVSTDSADMTVTVTCLADPAETFTAELTVTIAGVSETRDITVMSSSDSETAVTAVTFTQSQYFIKVDQGTYSPDLTVTVSASVNEDATVQGVTYSLTTASDSSHITLNTSTGLVTAATGTLGTYSITATSNGDDENGSHVTATCEVTVYSSAFYLSGNCSEMGSWGCLSQDATSLTSPYSDWAITATDSTNKTFSGTFTVTSSETWAEFQVLFLGMDNSWDGVLTQSSNMGTYSGSVFYEEGYTTWNNTNFQFQAAGSVTITVDLSGSTPTVNFS
ncbi:MAG: Ig-like domain-containing protein [Clostridia bacterium]|nr:Ig-like domain-containing protein [Clostridia bacterium]